MQEIHADIFHTVLLHSFTATLQETHESQEGCQQGQAYGWYGA